MIRIAHLSDIHFYESSDGAASRYRHSLDCLREIEKLLNSESPDFVVVTGDITNIGDTLNLERAYQWIHDKIYSSGEYYGLECVAKNRGVMIVPGNHDAFNAPKSGADLKRWQSGLTNYYSVFHAHKPDDGKYGVNYRWISRGNEQIFACLLDSCYLGDPETDHLTTTITIDKIGKGKISKKQSEQILSLYDSGLRGELQDDLGNMIPSGQFLASIKLIVMHHYLFEPSDSRAEPLLQLNDKKAAFQNIAMSDFDVLLCGHKHIADVQLLSYSDKFDPRAKIRLAFNYVRRSLGMRSLPLSYDEDGNIPAKLFRLLLGVLVLSKTKGAPLTDKHVEEIIAILARSIESPSILKDELFKYLNSRSEVRQAGLFDKQEILDLYSRIKKSFSPQQRKNLNFAANKLGSVISHLSGRPFAHIMSASSAKVSEVGTRHRAVSMYDITNTPSDNGYRLISRRFSWDESTNSFVKALQQDIVFPHARVAM